MLLLSIALNNKRGVIRLADTSTRLRHVISGINNSQKHFNWSLSNRLHWDCRQSLDDGSPMCIVSAPEPCITHAIIIVLSLEVLPPLNTRLLIIFSHRRRPPDRLFRSSTPGCFPSSPRSHFDDLSSWAQALRRDSCVSACCRTYAHSLDAVLFW